MAILRICAADGCGTKTLGQFCLEHELENALAQALSAGVGSPVVEIGKRRATPA